MIIATRNKTIVVVNGFSTVSVELKLLGLIPNTHSALSRINKSFGIKTELFIDQTSSQHTSSTIAIVLLNQVSITVHRQAILLLVVESGTRKFRCLSVECLFVESGTYDVICQFERLKVWSWNPRY